MEHAESYDRQISGLLLLTPNNNDLESTIQKVQELKALERLDVFVDLSFTIDILMKKNMNESISENVCRLFQIIGSLPKLHKLRIQADVGYVFREKPQAIVLPLEAMKVLLQQQSTMKTKSLKSLHLSHVNFVPTTSTMNSKHSSSNVVGNEQHQQQQQTSCRSECPLVVISKLLETTNNTALHELYLDYRKSCYNYHGGSIHDQEQQQQQQQQQVRHTVRVTRAGRQALVDMLKYKNDVLCRLHLDPKTNNKMSTKQKSQLCFYLTMNETKWRRQLLPPLSLRDSQQNNNNTNNTSSNEDDNNEQRTRVPACTTSISITKNWQKAVIANRENLRLVHFLLGHNPTILP